MCNKLILLSVVALAAVVGITHAQYGGPFGGVGGFGGGSGGGGFMSIIFLMIIVMMFRGMYDDSGDGGDYYPMGSGYGHGGRGGGFTPFNINVDTNIETKQAPAATTKTPPGQDDKGGVA